MGSRIEGCVSIYGNKCFLQREKKPAADVTDDPWFPCSGTRAIVVAPCLVGDLLPLGEE